MPGAQGTLYAFAPVNPSLAGVSMNLLARLHSLVVGLGAAAAFAALLRPPLDPLGIGDFIDSSKTY